MMTHDTDAHNTLVNLAMSMYLGERCKYCDKVYETIADLDTTVWAGYHEHGRLACETCWIENNPPHDNQA